MWEADRQASLPPFGLDAIIFERSDDLGGQLLLIHNRIENYLGRAAANGLELRDHFVVHLSVNDARICKRSSVVYIDVNEKTVGLENGETYSATAIIIATGVRRRTLGIPGELEFLGKGVLTSGAASKEAVEGRKVVVVGGGDAAIENAVILGEFAEKVTVIHRRSEFRARPELFAAAERAANIEFVLASQVTAINGNDTVRSIDVIDMLNRDRSSIPTDAVLIRIGVEPNSEILKGKLDLDDDGYIRVDALCAASTPFIFAIGDVASPVSPTISTAVGGGATAAKAISGLIKARQNL